MQLQDKVAVVTGGASGIGKALATRFVSEGARQVVIADLNEDGLTDVANQIGARAIRTDVANEQDVINLIRTTEQDYGQIDLLCNNAGIAMAGGPEVSNQDWQRIWEINVMAHIYATRAALPAMLERGEGYVVNTASAAGLLSIINQAPYAVTKHAAVAYAEWLSITYGDRGIKVSVLCPQAVRTAMTTGGASPASLDGLLEPEQLCDTVIEVLREETFLILPHAEVLTYARRKTSDYDRWIRGMRRLQAQYGKL
ncbi:MAG: SDR family NAD(P)-dependent oxidoreductase [Proteobacteria bacterium]|jgi:NAD(P)-dependent dehydrogenase (short-subunit alcohol dehydrogenase family)|nr:SDR family NAD(P)-dependent oxidoreductase [Pseudomonadota bacterium]MDA1299614.1 SDR family NAD(P)-dependent oxidoreductase [Pseudomonadota bacterium]